MADQQHQLDTLAAVTSGEQQHDPHMHHATALQPYAAPQMVHEDPAPAEPAQGDSDSEDERNAKWTNKEMKSLVKEYIAYKGENENRRFFTEEDCIELQRRVDTLRSWTKIRLKMVELLRRFADFKNEVKPDTAFSKFHKKLFHELETCEDPHQLTVFALGGGRGQKRKRTGSRTGSMERIGMQDELVNLARRTARTVAEFQKQAQKRHEDLLREIRQLKDLIQGTQGM